jgi:Carboxypeptidase regulatory-like domain
VLILRQPIIRRSVFLLCIGALNGCAHRYATHVPPACPAAYAQTHLTEERSASGMFTGTVLDRDTGRPLAQAFVQIAPTNQSTLSDSTGAFSIVGLQPGQHVISVRDIGYERLTDTITVRPHLGVRAEIALTSANGDRCMTVVTVRTPLPWWHFW